MVTSSKRSRDAFGLTLPPLILLTAFAAFVKFNDYDVLAPEIMLVAAVLAIAGLALGCVLWLGPAIVRVVVVAGLVDLYLDLQFDWGWKVHALVLLCALAAGWPLRRHLCQIGVVVFAAALASTLVLPVGSSTYEWVATTPDEPARADLPTIVHLVLDEHVGVDGIPLDTEEGRATAQALREFYRRNGFQVFGSAYSRYHLTRNFFANFVNFASEARDGSFFGTNEEPYFLERNAYFEEMAGRGYRIHVYQNDYLNLCKNHEQHVANCYTYPIRGLRSVAATGYGVRQRALLVGALFALLSEYYKRSRALYTRIRDGLPEGLRMHVPGWYWDAHGLGSVALPPVFERLGADLTGAGPGELYFAHLLMPHYPYAYDRACDLKAVRDWIRTETPRPGYTDRQIYAAYMQQIECLLSRLDTLLGALRSAGRLDDTVLIFSGDHGSRLWKVAPHAGNAATIGPRDYVEAFSTLFVVKLPGRGPGYSSEQVWAGELLQSIVRTLAEPDRPLVVQPEPPYVYLRGGPGREGDGLEMKRQPLPRFLEQPSPAGGG